MQAESGAHTLTVHEVGVMGEELVVHRRDSAQEGQRADVACTRGADHRGVRDLKRDSGGGPAGPPSAVSCSSTHLSEGGCSLPGGRSPPAPR